MAGAELLARHGEAKMRFSKLAMLAVVALGAMAMPSQGAEPVKLRIGWVVVPSDLAPMMFLKPGLAPHAGKTYTPELIHFAGTSTIVTALASGELDTAAIAYSTFALAIENAGMKDLRVIADSFQDGAPGYHTNDMMVRKESPIRTIEDLKGKVLATNEAGSAVDMAVRAMLSKHHLQDKRDVTMIEVKFPDMKAMLRESKVDLVATPAPFDLDPELTAFARTLFTQREAVGPTQMIMRVARQGFLDKNHAAMVDFMEDYLRTLHYLLDPANHREAVGIIAQATKQKPELYDNWAFTKLDYYRDPAGLPNLDVLQANIDTQKELGFLKTGFEVKKFADLGVVHEAAARLKSGIARQ
jgi:NitT/TauT family transport system substrate-binding protein